MNLAKITLKKEEGRTLRSGGSWVYDNEIEKTEGNFKDGDLVKVHAFNDFCLGTGFINSKSKIRIRMMTRSQDQVVDDDFIRLRVRDCIAYRKSTIDMSSCRLIFGEADFLPGLVVDKFEDILVVQSLALGIDSFKLLIIDEIKNYSFLTDIKIILQTIRTMFPDNNYLVQEDCENWEYTPKNL